MWDLSFPTRDRTCVLCTGRQILSHWTTREISPTPQIILCLETEGSARYIVMGRAVFLGNSGSHSGIPWMKFHWKLSMATNKEQRGNKPHQPVAELKSSILKAYCSQKYIPSSPEGRGPRLPWPLSVCLSSCSGFTDENPESLTELQTLYSSNPWMATFIWGDSVLAMETEVGTQSRAWPPSWD